MELKVTGEIVLAILLACIVFNLSPARTQASPEAAFFVDPPRIEDVTKTLGTTITVQVKVTEADYIYSWQIRMNWTSSILSTTVSAITFGGFLTTQPEGSTTNRRVESGWLVASEATRGTYVGKSAAEGLLVSITFSVIGTGETDITINDDLTYYLKCSTVPVLVKTYPTRADGYFRNTVAPDFSLSASPNTLSIACGSSGTSTITVTATSGFSSAVALTISGLPSGVTHTFVPASVTPPGTTTSVLTLTASASATSGPVTITVTGMSTSPALTKTTTISLTVTMQYNLTIDVEGLGTTDPAPGIHIYNEVTDVPVTAIPDSGHKLDHWTLDGVDVDAANPYTITMDADHDLVAFFVVIPTQHTLTISVDGPGTTNPTPGTLKYDQGSAVPVLATPDNGYILDHWTLEGTDAGSANPYIVTMNANHTLVAFFTNAPPEHNLAIEVHGEGTTDPVPGVYTYSENTVVSIAAIANPGFVFDYWTVDGANVGSANPYNVTMDADHSLGASFKLHSEPWIVDTSPPIVDAGEDQIVNAGIPATFDAGGSSDNVGIASYEWNFGDGTTGTGETTSHNYSNPGTYTVTLTVKDTAGNTATDTTTVTVRSAEVPPPTEAFPTWVIGAAVAMIAIAAAATVLWRRRK